MWIFLSDNISAEECLDKKTVYENYCNMWLLDFPQIHPDGGKRLCFRYYGGSTLDCVAQTEPLVLKEPVDRFKNFIKIKPKVKCQGIQNDGFQDDVSIPALKLSNSLEELSTGCSSEILGNDLGVKKKLSQTLRRSESTNGGGKKKNRPKEPQVSSKEYYQIWMASSALPKVNGTSSANEDNEEPAPPLPPRSLHKPLERTCAVPFVPPTVLRSNKPKTNVQKPEDAFNFELIDTDEINDASPDDYEKMENGVLINFKQTKPFIPNGNSLVDKDNYITTVFAKTKGKRNKPGPSTHSDMESKSSHSSVSTTHSDSSLEGSPSRNSDLASSYLVMKPHKPLSRQISPKWTQPHDTPKHTSHHSSVVRQTPCHVMTSPVSCSSEFAKMKIEPVINGGVKLGALLNDELVCPPTPTHHPKVNRTNGGLHPPSLKSSHEETQHSKDSRENIEKGIFKTWEARMDSHGRVFYIDHATRTTSWQRPTCSTAPGPGIVGAEQQRRQLDRRYQSIRRTISSGRIQDVEQNSATAANTMHPAVRLLTRPDFFNILHMNQDALSLYNRNATLKHMISKIRRESTAFEKYQHNKDLVALVNLFADTEANLPTGWDTKKDRNSKQFFIDHNNRKTTYMDPRLPTDTVSIAARFLESMTVREIIEMNDLSLKYLVYFFFQCLLYFLLAWFIPIYLNSK
ncbi:uncharacterized protein LOC112905468 [Agrilus planipennis]|uniref:Uncharacterized protein LOC112905468 n=1 Tax=Agrilus planipennis TaxID=224129 RepID=A0A7F5RCU2_AGRPL|nr:uncharacterized protein LOC112905468 [Agrilus planipennis]